MKEVRSELLQQGVLTMDGLRWSDGYAWCELRPTYDLSSGSVNIRYLWSSQCRRGYATALLGKIIQAADKLGRALYLEVQPFRKSECGTGWCFEEPRHGGMPEPQLVAWYQQHGFERVDGKVMMRKASNAATGHPSKSRVDHGKLRRDAFTS